MAQNLSVPERTGRVVADPSEGNFVTLSIRSGLSGFVALTCKYVRGR